jgi:putative membrane protein
VADNRRTIWGWLWLPPLAGRLWVAVVAAAVYSAGVWAVHPTDGFLQPLWASQVAAFNTAILGLLVSFRTKIAYDRWWEGRLLWGSLVNHSRNLCLKAREMAKPESEDRATFAALVSAFPVSLMRHLRGSVQTHELSDFEKQMTGSGHVPAHIAGRIIGMVAGWRTADRIDGFEQQLLDLHTSALMDICGACERIRNTPLATSYLSLLRHGLVLGFLFTPWALVQTLQPWTVPVQAIAVYFLFGIELTAESVEQPFGYDRDDLTLEAYCETIQKSVKEILQ